MVNGLPTTRGQRVGTLSPRHRVTAPSARSPSAWRPSALFPSLVGSQHKRHAVGIHLWFRPSRSPLTHLFHSQYGNTALLWAAKNGHVAVVETLLDRGADVGHENKVRRPSFGLVVLFGGVDCGTQVLRWAANFR